MLRRASEPLVALALTTMALSAWADGVAVHAASTEQLRAAQKTFLAGDELFDAGRFEEAISAYRASHEIVRSPNSSLQIARSAKKIGRIEHAYRAYEKTVSVAQEAVSRDAKKYAPTLEVAQKEFGELKASVALLTIKLIEPPRGTELSVGKRRLQAQDLSQPLVVAPGDYAVVVNAPGKRTKSQQVSLAAASARTVSFDFESDPVAPPPPLSQEAPRKPPISAQPPPEEEGSNLKPAAYIAGGVGIAGLAAFTVFGLMHNSKKNELDEACPNKLCPRDRESDIDDAERYQTFANIGLAVGIAGLATGTTLLLLDSGGSKSRSKRHPTAQLRVGPGSVRVTGHF